MTFIWYFLAFLGCCVVFVVAIIIFLLIYYRFSDNDECEYPKEEFKDIDPILDLQDRLGKQA